MHERIVSQITGSNLLHQRIKIEQMKKMLVRIADKRGVKSPIFQAYNGMVDGALNQYEQMKGDA